MVTAMLPKLLTAREVAAQTNLSVQRVYELTRVGELPSIKFGRSYRYDPAEVLERFRSGCSRSTT